MDIYNPSTEDFIFWINSEKISWPDQDWDFSVTHSGTIDELIFRFANDNNCKKRDFCIHCLYYMVGEYFNDSIALSNKMDEMLKTKVVRYENRISKLMNMIEQDSSKDVLEWKQLTSNLLIGKIEFNPQFWFNYMFQSGININPTDGFAPATPVEH